jgi:large subunit ribosomal protein L10
MPNVVTEMISREIKGSFEESEAVLFVTYGGLTVEENEDIRDQLAEKGVRLRMIRNKLAHRALGECGIDITDDVFVGNVAITLGSTEDTISAAKVLTDSKVKKLGKVKLRAGIMEGALLSPEDAAALADVPDKDTLRAQMLGVISGPARSIASLVAAPGGALARVLQARVDQGGEAEAAEAS